MEGKTPVEGTHHDHDPRRVYPPSEVQSRLEVSASGLRRLAGIYERTVGPLPRDERGRVWPEDAVDALEVARSLVRDGRAVSIDAALRGQSVEGEAEPHSVPARPSTDEINPGAAILAELRALREAQEENNRRMARLEEALGIGAELNAPATVAGLEAPEDGTDTVTGPEGGTATVAVPGTPPESTDAGLWRRVASWFGFGGLRS
jgi:hypothetical protein